MIEFIKDFDRVGINDAFNNSIIVFRQDLAGIKVPVYATVTVGEFTYDITPNIEGVFKFNFKPIIKTISNTSKFNDLKEPDIVVSGDSITLTEDENLYSQISSEVFLYYNDLTNDSETVIYKFTNSVKQLLTNNYKRDSRMFPLSQSNSNIYHITYFDGFPFDVSIYSNQVRNINVRNKRTGLSTDINLNIGVGRLFFSNGAENSTLMDLLLTYEGFNELEFIIGTEVVFTVIFKKSEAKKGVYLKWFNQDGAFSYWLLPNNINYLTSGGTKGIIERDDQNLEDTNSIFSIIGKTANSSVTTVSQILSKQEYRVLEQILLSPKVYILNKERFDKVELMDFVEVGIANGTFEDKSKHNVQKLPFNITLPSQFTQTR